MMSSVDEEDEDDLDDPSQQDDPAPMTDKQALNDRNDEDDDLIGENPETSLMKKLRDVCNPNTMSADNARDSRYF